MVLSFGGTYICANFGENRSRNATVRVLSDGQIHRLTDANRFLQRVRIARNAERCTS